MHDVSSNGSFAKVQSILNDEEEKVVPYIRSSNVGETFLNPNNLIKISDKAHKKLPLSKTNYLDIMMARKGKIGGATIIMKDNIDFNCNENVIKITIKDKVTWNPYYLTTFFNSVYGKKQLERQSTGNVQPWVSIYQIKKLNCVKGSKGFQEKIEKTILVSYDKWQNSEKLYTQAQNLLISELGLENFNPSNEKVSIKTLKESFLKTGRLDSEYYQPKYDEILNKITKYGCSEFTNFVDSYTTGYPYSSDGYVEKDGIALIKISNINNFKLDISSTSLIPKKYIDLSLENVVQKNDILVSMSGTIGNSCIVQDDIKAVVNQRIMKIKSKNINPVVFSLIINSMIGKNQLERIQTGGVQANISLKDILKIQIPCIKTSVQDEIANYIKQSMEYSKKAKELLEIATKSVEIAIDKDETAAHNFLEQNRTLIVYYNEQASYYINLAIFRLYEEIGLFDNLKSVNYTVKNLRDTFGSSGRLDSEYYQEKYDRLFEKLSGNNCDKLSNLVTIKKSIEPGSESYQTKGTPFIRIQDLTKFGLTDTSVYLSENKFKDCIRPKKNTILLSKDGTVGIAYKMDKDEDIITSSAILHLDTKDNRVLPDYLALVLNSVVVKIQAEKDAGGSIINHWKKSEIENVIIPIIAKEKQEQISKLLIESETLRRESKSLLEKAIKSVEMAIEGGEEKAIAYLNS